MRFGGDEFLCVISDAESGDVRRRFGGVNGDLVAAVPPSSVTVGLAEYQHGESIEQLIDRADVNLLDARRNQDAGADARDGVDLDLRSPDARAAELIQAVDHAQDPVSLPLGVNGRHGQDAGRPSARDTPRAPEPCPRCSATVTRRVEELRTRSGAGVGARIEQATGDRETVGAHPDEGLVDTESIAAVRAARPRGLRGAVHVVRAGGHHRPRA